MYLLSVPAPVHHGLSVRAGYTLTHGLTGLTVYGRFVQQVYGVYGLYSRSVRREYSGVRSVRQGWPRQRPQPTASGLVYVIYKVRSTGTRSGLVYIIYKVRSTGTRSGLYIYIYIRYVVPSGGYPGRVPVRVPPSWPPACIYIRYRKVPRPRLRLGLRHEIHRPRLRLGLIIY